MAVLDFNAEEKFRAYHVLACLNRSFRNIVNNLGELNKAGILNAKQLNTLRGISQELQADVNFHALEQLHAIELKTGVGSRGCGLRATKEQVKCRERLGDRESTARRDLRQATARGASPCGGTAILLFAADSM